MPKYLILLLTVILLCVSCEQLSDKDTSTEIFEVQPSLVSPPTPTQELIRLSETQKDENQQSKFNNPGCSNLPDDVVCTCINGSWHNCYSLHDTETKTPSKKAIERSKTLVSNDIQQNGTSGSYETPNPNTEPSISLYPTISSADTFVQATGIGFPANSSILITYHYGNSSSNRATFTTNSQGYFSNMFPIPPDVTPGSQNLVRASANDKSLDGALKEVASSTNHFVPASALTATTEPLVSGNKITISGQSFNPYTSLKYLQIGDLTVLPNPIPVTDENGEFSSDITIPNLAPGLHLLVAIVGDKTSSTYLNISKESSFNPLLRIEPELSYPGDTIIVTGTGYPINTNVLITYVFGLSSLNVGNVLADSQGNFNHQITVPTGATSQTNNLVQTISNANLGNNFFETVRAGARHYVPLSLLRISNPKVLPGDILTLSGEGFEKNEDITSITLGSSTIITMTNNKVDSYGKFETEFVIPRLSPGVHLLTVTTTSSTTSKFIEITN